MCKYLLKTFFFLLGMFLCSTTIDVYAAEEIVVRVSALPKAPWVGQKVTLLLDVVARDGWAHLQKVPAAEISGGYLRRFETQGTRVNETIDGVAFSGQRYEYLFFPQQDGEITTPAIPIEVEVKSWEQDSATRSEQSATPTVVLEVRRPPGLGSVNGVISTTHFSAIQQWEPRNQKSLNLGDALTRKVTRSASDTLGMIFFPLNHVKTTSMGIYPSEPTVDDTYSRGSLTGKRSDTVTYVMEKVGSQTIPDLEFIWWNTTSEKFEKITLPGLTFNVNKSGVMKESSETAIPYKRSLGFNSFLLIALVLLIVAATGLFLKVPLQRFYRWRKTVRDEFEKSYFNKVKSAAKTNDPRKMMRTTIQWLDRISEENSPARLDLFLSRYGEVGSLKTALDFMSQLSADNDAQKTRNFYATLVTARGNWLKSRKPRRRAESLLPEVGLSKTGQDESRANHRVCFRK